jgi:hypothetical protein
MLTRVHGSGSSGARTRLIAIAVILVVAAPLVVLAVSRGDGGEAPGLRVEVTPGGGGPAQLSVFIEDQEQNVPATAGGRRTVTLECSATSGKVLLRRRQPWPLPDTDGGTLASHVHQGVPARLASQLKTCRLNGTRGPLQGSVGPAG